MRSIQFFFHRWRCLWNLHLLYGRGYCSALNSINSSYILNRRNERSAWVIINYYYFSWLWRACGGIVAIKFARLDYGVPDWLGIFRAYSHSGPRELSGAQKYDLWTQLFAFKWVQSFSAHLYQLIPSEHGNFFGARYE